MIMKTLLSLLVPICCVATFAAQHRPDSIEYGLGFAISCGDQVAIKTTPSGVASVSVQAKKENWSVALDLISDVGPAVAANTVALVSNGFHTIYAFSKQTGKVLWKKEHRTNLLATDGRYFYVLRPDYDGIAALSPDSGETVWSLQISRQKGRPVDFGFVDGGFLYTDLVVVDLSKRIVVHTWPEHPAISTIDKSGDGEIFVGDLSGVITVYGESFTQLRTMPAGNGAIVQLTLAGKDVLAAVYDHRVSSTHGQLVLMTREGNQIWHFVLSSDHWLDQHPFFALDDDVLVVEPGTAKNKMRLVSRKLSTGEMNWATTDGDFEGPPAVCGQDVYLAESEQILSFSARTGEAINH